MAWLDFYPGKLAREIREMTSPRTDKQDKDIALQLWKYHTEYLRVTAHGEKDKPSPMADGTTVYWSWQAATEAMFFQIVYGMAIGLHDPDDFERGLARRAWKEADWEAMWSEYKRDAKSVNAPKEQFVVVG